MKNSLLTDKEIARFSHNYVKMRSFSVHKMDCTTADYDKRNTPLLIKYRRHIESVSGLSIESADRVELQCLRYMAMREEAIREFCDGLGILKMTAENYDRITAARQKFDDMAENHYIHHQEGINDHHLSKQALFVRLRAQGKSRVDLLEDEIE